MRPFTQAFILSTTHPLTRPPKYVTPVQVATRLSTDVFVHLFILPHINPHTHIRTFFRLLTDHSLSSYSPINSQIHQTRTYPKQTAHLCMQHPFIHPDTTDRSGTHPSTHPSNPSAHSWRYSFAVHPETHVAVCCIVHSSGRTLTNNSLTKLIDAVNRSMLFRGVQYINNHTLIQTGCFNCHSDMHRPTILILK